MGDAAPLRDVCSHKLGPVSKHLESALRELARQHGIVVWLDKPAVYTAFADGLKARADAGEFPYPVRCFRGSFLALMRELDGLEDGIGPKPLVVHVPGFSAEGIVRTPLLELYRAGLRKEFGLPTLIKEAAYGRATVEQLDAFLASEPLTLEAADAWLSNLGAGPQAEGPDLSALSAEALLDALTEGGLLAGRVAEPPVERAVWQRAQVLLGLSAEERERFREERRSAAAGGDPRVSAASDVLFALVSWVLKVEFVHDLKRPPRSARLLPLRNLPAPVVEACQKAARHLRARYAEDYARWADECEVGLAEELEATTAEDLGQVDTFRSEDQKILVAALEALRSEDYAAAHRWAVARGAGKSFWTQHDRQRYLAWSQVELAAQLGCEVQKHVHLLKGAKSHAEAVERYAEKGFAVDAAHRRLEQAREQAPVLDIEEFTALRQGLEQMRHVYRRWADEQAQAFNALCREQGFLPTASLQQRTLFEDVVRPWTQEPGCTAYFMVDALRFELAQQLATSLSKARGATVQLKARLAELPTITAVGMNVLAPLAQAGKLRVEINSKGEIRSLRSGQARVSTPEERQKAIHERVGGKTCPKLSLEEVLDRDVTSLRKTVAEARMLIVHSEGIDKAGEKGVGLLVFEQELRKIQAAWGQLLAAGVLRCVITADHGFLLHDATTREPVPHGFKTDPDRRHVVSFEHLERPREVSVSARDLGYEVDANAWFLFPESSAPFDLGDKAKNYVHGGNSLQERVIPVLTVQHKHAAGTSLGRYRIAAGTRPTPVSGARAHSLPLNVVTQGQTGLAFGGAKEMEIALECAEDPRVTVQVTDVTGARLVGNVVVATLERPFEVFFRLTGPESTRVRVRAKHATADPNVEAFTSEERFSVDEELCPTPASDAPASKAERTPAPQVATVVADAWLLELPEGGVREVFRHLAVHGSVNEAEATRMLGGGRQFRNFSRRFEEYARRAPFSAHVQTVSGTKCYVRGER